MARGVSLTGAERALDMAEDLQASEPSALNLVSVAQAAFWLGQARAGAKEPLSSTRAAFERGRVAAREAQRADAEEPGGYYWEAVNRASLAEIDGLFSSAHELPALVRLMDRTDALKPGYSFGGTSRFRGVVVTRTPAPLLFLNGVSLDRGAQYFRQSLATSPQCTSTRVLWAELKVRQGDREGAKVLLREALDAVPAADADLEVWNLQSRVLAESMLRTLDETSVSASSK